jgi:hypothetical protein
MIEYSINTTKIILPDNIVATIQHANDKLNGDLEHDHYVMLALMQSLDIYGDDVMYLYEYLVEIDSGMRDEYFDPIIGIENHGSEDAAIEAWFDDKMPGTLAVVDEAVVVLEEILGYPSNQDYIDGLVVFEEEDDDDE